MASTAKKASSKTTTAKTTARKTAAKKAGTSRASASKATADSVTEADADATVAPAPRKRVRRVAKAAAPSVTAAPEVGPAETKVAAEETPAVAPKTRRRVTKKAAAPASVEVEAPLLVATPSLEELEQFSAPPATDDAPTVPGVGVIFQAPQIFQALTAVTRPRRVVAEPTEVEEDREDATDAEGSLPNRRRRGGKGRRRLAEGDVESSEVSADSVDGDETEASEDGVMDDGEQTGRRRTRRRRRSTSGTAVEGEDPPGTVTRVRTPRRERTPSAALGIKGSTRLEAKKQRRREGREAGRRRQVITEAEFLARRESVDRVMVVRESEQRTQIGILEDGVLVEHFVAQESSSQTMAGNIYLGRVQNVLPSMEAAFVDIGKGRNAVLYAGEVNWDAAGLDNGRQRRIENALSSGQSVLVQVTKDPIGHKGARLTSQISLPGRYLVYVPEGRMTGISRKLPDTERTRLKRILRDVVPESAGVIVRTAAEGASEEELTTDVQRLTALWEKIQAKSTSSSAPALLHGEPDMTIRVVRDIFNEDFAKLIVAGEGAWATISDYVESVAPDLRDRVEKWTGTVDVFSHHRVEEQLAKAMDRKVWLPSGGSLVIDRTEAMTVVDVNTGKFVGSGGNLEETVTKNNIEAAEEIVRQLRLRDIGGIIVIDFIDMVLESNRELVIRRLLECLGRDRTKHQVAEVTSLGLVQMTRKRVGVGLLEAFSQPCEHCSGRGIKITGEFVDSAPPVAAAPAQPAPATTKKRRGRGRATSAAAQPPAAAGPTPAQIAAAAHAAAVGATHSDHGSAPAVETSAPPEPVAAAEPSVTPPSTLPHTMAVEPAAPVRARRKRTRVMAPAGPPKPVTEDAATETDAS